MPYVPPPVAAATGSATPTLIAVATTFTIAANTQMLFKVPCKLDGTLIINGTRVNT